MAQAISRHHFSIFITYNDDSEFFFEVTLDDQPNNVYAELLMITRGTLMASMGQKAIAYNDEGFEVCAYTKE